MVGLYRLDVSALFAENLGLVSFLLEALRDYFVLGGQLHYLNSYTKSIPIMSVVNHSNLSSLSVKLSR